MVKSQQSLQNMSLRFKEQRFPSWSIKRKHIYYIVNQKPGHKLDLGFQVVEKNYSIWNTWLW